MHAWSLAVLLALAPVPALAQSRPDLMAAAVPERFVCPPTPQIDCMPIVPEERRAFCGKDYLEWAEEHCPGLKVLH